MSGQSDLAPAAESRLLQQSAELTGFPLLGAEALPQALTLPEDIPLPFLAQNRILPLGMANGALRVACPVPLDFVALDALRQFVGVPVKVLLAPRADIDARMAEVVRSESQRSTPVGIFAEIDLNQDDEQAALDDSLEALRAIAEDAPVVRLVNTLIARAAEARASDLHFEIFQGRFRIRFRIDGVLHDVESPPLRMFLPVISHLKLRARMNIAERRLPQDGRAKVLLHDREIDMRVSTIPIVHGESMVIRLLDQAPGLLQLEALGVNEEGLKIFQGAIRQPHGMILVTGPTGSGKTTTLYAALSRINNARTKIITIEDPVEYQLDGINQMQVKPQIDLTFANALRSIVRQDPDVIMVGEIRDRETAEIAIQSSLTGHLVFSTLHTNDSFSAAHRLLEMGVEGYLIASSIIVIVAQRLVRLVCPHCRVTEPPTASESYFLSLHGVGTKELALAHGTGCSHCTHTGYAGRTGIYELLPMTAALKEGVVRKLPAEGLRQVALGEGVRPMQLDGIRKVLAGTTTLEELARVTRQEV
jgi:general secretion pathway protein E